MTLVQDRPDVGNDRRLEPVARSVAPRWRLAARLARREVRRRPGRSALVALLVAVPVIAMTAASVMYRTGNDDWSATYERRFGASDLGGLGSPDNVVSGLPPGSRVVESVETWTGLELADGTTPPEVWVRFTDLPLDDSITSGIVDVRRGRVPTAGDEVLLDGRTADRLGVGVGDTLTLARPSGDWRVVGIGRLTDNHRQGLMVVHDFDRDRFRPDRADRLHLIELPAATSAADAAATMDVLERAGLWTENRWEPRWSAPTESGRVLAWGWVAGVLALAAVGIVIAAAFATSARRQLVTIGHLAANGAPAELVRRTLALQGSWTGLIGVTVGMTLATAGLFAGRPLVEHVANRSLGGYRFASLDLAVIALTAVVAATVAAAVPARTAARVPVLSALAGRRPLGDPPRRLVPIGVSLFLGGLGLLFVAASGARANDSSGSGDGDVFAVVAVLGGLAVVFGMCCATPLVVSWVGRLGAASSSGTWRLAARSTARARTRSAGVVTAVATAGAFAVAGVTVAAIAVDDTVSLESLPRDVALVYEWTDWYQPDANGRLDPPPLQPLVVDPAVRDRIDRIVPDARWTIVRAVGIDPRPFDAERGPQPDPQGREVRVEPFVATIADQEVLELAGLSASDEALLDAFDLVEVAPWSVEEGLDASAETNSWVLSDEAGDVTVTRAVATTGRLTYPIGMLMSAERAEALGLDVVEIGALLTNPTDLTPTQRRELEAVTYDNDSWRTAFVEPGDASIAADGPQELTSGLSVQMAWDTQRIPVGLINGIILGLAVLFTLLVVAIGLSLSATESRDERDVLTAVGAPPRTLSRVAGSKAFVLAATGVLLAVPTGFVPIWVVYRTVGEAVRFPWPMVGLLVVVVPAVAGLAAWVTSGLARRVRPVRMSSAFAE